MRDLLRYIAIEIVLLLFVGVGLGPSVLNEVVIDPVLERNRISDCRLFALIDSVEDLEYLSTN
jgi:hypothetical protein